MSEPNPVRKGSAAALAAAAACAVGGAAWAAFCAVLWASQRARIFRPEDSRSGPEGVHAGEAHLPARKTIETSPDGAELERWTLRSTRPDAPWMVWFAGRGEDVSWMLAHADAVPSWNLVLAQHRGFGRSTGVPGEAEMVEDASRLLSAVRSDHPGVPVCVGGRSLGTGVAVAACARSGADLCFLLTPYDSMATVIRSRVRIPFPVSRLLAHRFDSGSIARSGAASARLVSVVAEFDRTIPRASSAALFDAWPGEKSETVVPGAGHVDVAHRPEFWEILEAEGRRLAEDASAESRTEGSPGSAALPEPSGA